jgi:enoyl-CoA hydratase/carnithine racemase
VDYKTIIIDIADHVATVTLNRPDRLNAFNRRMVEEFDSLWRLVKEDDNVRVVVLRAAGERAFCTGIDVNELSDGEQWKVPDLAVNPFKSLPDPGEALGPKHNAVWKPLLCALHGMVAGGAQYWINEADIVICSEDATFFDPHLSYGMTSAYEPIGLRWRIPIGEALRWTLLGLDERMSAERALAIGLVSEVTSRDVLWERADELARIIAAKPPAAVQGTVRAFWESMDHGRSHGQQLAGLYTTMGNPAGTAEVDRTTFQRPTWRLR